MLQQILTALDQRHIVTDQLEIIPRWQWWGHWLICTVLRPYYWWIGQDPFSHVRAERVVGKILEQSLTLDQLHELKPRIERLYHHLPCKPLNDYYSRFLEISPIKTPCPWPQEDQEAIKSGNLPAYLRLIEVQRQGRQCKLASRKEGGKTEYYDLTTERRCEKREVSEKEAKLIQSLQAGVGVFQYVAEMELKNKVLLIHYPYDHTLEELLGTPALDSISTKLNLMRQIFTGLDLFYSLPNRPYHQNIQASNIGIRKGLSLEAELISFENAGAAYQGSYWDPPEVAEGKPFEGHARDIWSLGVLFSRILLNSKTPLPSIQANQVERIDEEIRLQCAKSSPLLNQLWQLNAEMVKTNPAQRISFRDARERWNKIITCFARD